MRSVCSLVGDEVNVSEGKIKQTVNIQLIQLTILRHVLDYNLVNKTQYSVSDNSLKGSIMQICCNFKTQKCLSVSRNKEIIVKFVINYHPSGIKLSITASGQRQSRPVWIET